MKSAFTVVVIAILSTITTTGAQRVADTDHAVIIDNLGKLPIHFVENRGLCAEEVAYFVRGADKTLFFHEGGVTIALEDGTKRWAVKLDFVGADPTVKPRGVDLQRAVFSYFSREQKDWRTGLPAFGKIVYEGLWPGIDLIYRGTVNQMKYEFVVHPGADPGRIRMRYRGAERVAPTAEETLRVETPAGAFEDARPVAYQIVDGKRRLVEMAYDLPGVAEASAVDYGFRLGDHDPELPLILDPAVLIYCGYIGGDDYDDNYAGAVDAAGNFYVTGEVDSATPSFPVNVGPDLTYNANGDAYVAKVDPTGRWLLYCGYIGGTDYDYGEGIAVDNAGNAYIIGYTDSDQSGEQFPVKVGPDLTFAGNTDAFVAKVDPTGTSLVYCGYVGGNKFEYPFDIAVDAAGNAYVCGDTNSNQTSDRFPVTVGPDLTHNGGSDTFVAKINAAGTAFVYCGYIGGAQSDGAWGGIAVDKGGNAYVLAETHSNETTDNFPVLVGPDLTYNDTTGGDCFVAKVNATGSGLVYCGYIGGAKTEYAGGIDVDAAGNAYACGQTLSNETGDNFPVKVGPDLFHNNGSDAFVAKVSATGSTLVYCGYIGGFNSDGAWAIAVDSQNNAIVAGDTTSNEVTFPVSGGPDLTYNGKGDAFVTRVNSAGTGLDYCGYVGGAQSDAAYSVAVDTTGNAYVGGDTGSNETTDNFPVLVGPDTTYNTMTDAFVSKVSFTHLTASGAPRPGNTISLALTATDDAGLTYQAASSLGTGPIPVDTRQIGLSPDAIFFTSLSGAIPGIFANYAGFIDQQGRATAAINLPSIPALVGTTIHSAFITLSSLAPSNIKSISNTYSFKIAQ